MWQIITSEPKSAQELMDLDAHFLETLNVPTIHFYKFKGPSLTYGLLMKPEEHLHLDVLKNEGINLGKRPTGGGALFHLWDLAFSVIIPLKDIPHIKTTLERYFVINQLTDEAIAPFLDRHLHKEFLQKTPLGACGERFCMAKPTQYDVMVEGKKCVGAAQRVTKTTLLHQATISLCAPDIDLLKRVLIDEEVALAMEKTSFYLQDFSYHDEKKLSQFQDILIKNLEQVFQKGFSAVFTH